jgi:hypothetical protein
LAVVARHRRAVALEVQFATVAAAAEVVDGGNRQRPHSRCTRRTGWPGAFGMGSFLPLHAHTRGQRPVDPVYALASLLLTAGVAAPQDKV